MDRKSQVGAPRDRHARQLWHAHHEEAIFTRTDPIVSKSANIINTLGQVGRRVGALNKTLCKTRDIAKQLLKFQRPQGDDGTPCPRLKLQKEDHFLIRGQDAAHPGNKQASRVTGTSGVVRQLVRHSLFLQRQRPSPSCVVQKNRAVLQRSEAFLIHFKHDSNPTRPMWLAAQESRWCTRRLPK